MPQVLLKVCLDSLVQESVAESPWLEGNGEAGKLNKLPEVLPNADPDCPAPPKAVGGLALLLSAGWLLLLGPGPPKAKILGGSPREGAAADAPNKKPPPMAAGWAALVVGLEPACSQCMHLLPQRCQHEVPMGGGTNLGSGACNACSDLHAVKDK